jgi:FixJ family two-component response regulator
MLRYRPHYLRELRMLPSSDPVVQDVPMGLVERLPTMMIVGDPAALNIAREALVELELGWEVLFAASAFDILDIPSLRDVDVVLVDLGSPHLDGVEVVAELHQRFPQLPIVLMSAPFGVRLALEAMQQGACNHFPRDLLDSEPTAILDLLRRVVREQQQQRHTMQQLATLQFTFTLNNDRSLVCGVVQRLKDATIEVGVCDQRSAIRLGVALEEAILNAIIHGNLEVSSALRTHDEANFENLIRTRMTQEPYARRRVTVTAKLNPTEAIFVIKDEGPGFIPANVPDPTTPTGVTAVGGRGLLLMRSFTNGVQYNEHGNEVTLVKKRG